MFLSKLGSLSGTSSTLVNSACDFNATGRYIFPVMETARSNSSSQPDNILDRSPVWYHTFLTRDRLLRTWSSGQSIMILGLIVEIAYSTTSNPLK